jgi:pimeloyl-ACP methyl ester carboxylesterase
VTQPVLVLWGDHDPSLEAHTADPGPAWADVAMRHFEGAGHWVHLDAPDDVNAALIDFFRDGTPREARRRRTPRE